MRSFLLHFHIIALITLVFASGSLLQAQGADSLSIVALDPRPNQADASAATSISVTFNQPASGDFDAGAFVVYGERAGAVSGNVALSADSLVLTFKPDAPFIVGDRITAILVKQPANPSPLLQNGYIWEFDIAPGDGRQDFVTAQYASNLRLTSITSADLDGDGLVDLAFTGSNGYDDILKLAYLRDGELVFGDSIALPDRVRPLYSADLNRDGYPDFLMLHRGKTKFSIPPRISICHLAPDGSLSLEETFTVGESVTGSAEPRSAIINDVNGDGWLDIVVQLKNKATRAAAYVYLNDGTGHFSSSVGAPPSFDKSRNAESIFDRDLNLTGFIDVGVGHTSSIATVNMYLNDGDGNFTDSGEKLSMLTRDLENAKSLDFTGDLNPDIVLADFNNGEVLIYDWVDTTSSDVLTLPVPVFSSSPRVYSTMQNPNWMDYADVDRDGDFDLAVTGSNQAFFRIMLNDNGDFSQNIDVPIPPQPGNFSTADVNGDAALDFIVADTSGAITILYNNVGDFAAPQPPTLIRPADSVYTTNASPEFEWTVPADANAQDSLHFRITITTGNGVETVYDSRTNPELFTPTPPVPQGVGTIVFQPPDMFDDGAYHWSVQAWDGMFWSNPSSEWLFTVDTTPPVLLQMTFPKADYNGKWFAIAADSNIAAEITYTEWNPDYAELSTNGLGGPFQYQNLPAGDNVSAELTFIPLDAPDGEYNINVVLFDKTAQSDAIDGVVGVDHNPPTGGTARSAVDTSATLDFRISWDGATDGDGSGLSGDYRVQYRKDGGQWTIWIEKTNKSDSLFSGEHNSYYEFEASAFDNVGFVEPFNDVAETGVFVNKFANDKTPPPPPLNVRANGDNPSPWQKSGNFTIRWDLPADESGIKSSFWKLGSAPTSNDDFDDSGAPLGPAEVVVDRDGATPFYVWLSDSAGNVDYRNAAAVDLRRDSTLPVIHSMSVKGGYVVPVLVDGVPWFNSQADKYFNTEVVYTEINAQKGVLTTDGLSDSLINTGADLATGENVATLFGFSIQNPADRIYTLKSTIIDSADNKSSKSTPMGLDGHPPQNSLASSPAISASETFMVSWSAGDDGSGSGVAGYDLYYKVNDGPWQPWFSTDSVGSEPFTGQNGFEYSFESVARDFMGLSEDRSVSGEATTLVDLAANDKEPPPPPIDLKANGARPASPWTANADFNITWSKPQDESGVVASYWKLGAPPVSNADTTGSGPAEGSMLVRMTETGKQWLYLWLIDAKGNVDFNNADSVLLRFDDKPPKIVETTFLNPGYGADWYNPEKKDSAYFEITYHEQFADSLRLFSEDWKYDIVETAPVSGVGVRRVFALALASRPTGVGELIITLSDSAGNKVRAVDTLRLDLTPPTGSLASSPDTSGTTSFQVSWSPGQDVGVGVSDTFDVFVKVNNRGWLPWLTDYVGRTALFTDGRDKQIVHFEVVGRDWLGNVENRTYAYESTTYIDIALSDSVAPGPPIDLQADGGNPSPWRTTNEFQVTWQAPQDPTGTPKGWFKLGDPPTGAGDTSGSFIGDPPVVIRATQENGQRLHLWLQDGAGNVDYRNHASVNLRYDATPPKIDSLALEGAFAHRWYNPTVPPHKAVLDIYFKERNPSILRLDPSDLFKPDSLALRTGRDSASFELNFEGMNDADVDLQISLLDSAGNRAQASTTLSLDRTPPRNTVAQSPDTTTPGEFVVSWDVSHVEENGSGLSGIFDVKVQIDDGPWQLWKVRWDKTSAVYVGEEGHKYSFEAAAYDNVGNKEDFLGRAETTTWVVTQFVDTTPPDAPMNMTVNGVAEPLWSNRSEFTINWTQPSDPSGIAKAFYKFDEPPADNNDVDGEAAGTPPIVIEMQEDGVRDVYIWLQDGAGNADAAHYNVVTLKYDGTPPVIRKSIVANAVYDDKWLNPDSTETAQIRVTYDEFFADSLKLFFTGAEMQVEKTELTSGEAQEVDVLLPLQDVGDGCYALAVVLSDSAGNAASDSMFVCLDSTPPQGAAASSPERSITGKFTVSWAGEGAGFDDGSGLSGEYDLRMRIGGGPWFEVLSREKRSSYTYVGAHNNRFYFEVAAWDNAGNREAFTGEPETSTLVDTSFIDQTPPDAPIEPVVRGGNPSPWQNQPEFMVTWQNPVDPSGIATAFYKLGGAPQSNEDFTDSVTVDNGDGRAVIAATEEDGQIVYLWLKDGRGNVNFENAASVLLRYDATPPLIKSITPVQPAFGDNWYNQQQTPVVSFDVAYLEAHPDSLVLANDLFGAAAGDVSPAVETADTVRVKIKVEAAPDGAYRLYAFLADSAGNISEADSVEIHFDSKPPRVSVAHRDTVVEQGKTVSLTATANDENELQAVELLYWQGGQRIRQTAPMTLQGDSTFVGDIPGDAVTSRGVEYLIQASDGVNTVRYPLSADNQKPFFLRVRVAGEDGGLVMADPLPYGSEESAYRMISFPLQMEQPSARDILEPVLGSYDIKVWRFFYWQAELYEFQEYPDIESLSDGIGYWIITTKQDVRLHTGAGLSVNTVEPYVIVLKKGWNDIGLPFNFPVDWNDIIASSAVDTQKVQGPHAYTGRWEYPFESGVLQPWNGYSIYSDEDDISLVIPALEAQASLAKSQAPPFALRRDMDWAFEIKAVYGDAVDASNYFGCIKSATMKWDYGLDYVEAPEIGTYVSLYFPHDDWTLDAERYTSDFRPPQKGHVWDFEVATNKKDGDIRLSFRAVVPPPKSLELHLLDTEANMKIDLTGDSVYTFQLSGKETLRHFKIFAGDAEFIQQHKEDLPKKLTQYELVQNYPNPFNSSTIISYELEKGTEVNLAVYNLLAQKVKQLHDGWQEKGFYQIRWDARDDLGYELGTGVYILRLETPDFTSTRKMVYMR